MQRRVLVAVIVVSLLFLLIPVGCNETWEVKATIGPDGGELEATDPGSPIFGAKLVIPAGAVDEDVVISLSEGIHEDDSELIGVPISCKPDGYLFNQNVTLTIPWGGAIPEDDLLMLLVYNATSSTYEYADRLIEVHSGDTHASANISHFSSFSLIGLADFFGGLGTVIDQAYKLLAIGTAYAAEDVLALESLKQDLLERNIEYLNTMRSQAEFHDWCLDVFNFDWFIEYVIQEICITAAIYTSGMISALLTGMTVAAATAVLTTFTTVVSIAVLAVVDVCFLSTSFASPAFLNAYAGFVLTELEMLLIDEILADIVVFSDDFEYDDSLENHGWTIEASNSQGDPQTATDPENPGNRVAYMQSVEGEHVSPSFYRSFSELPLQPDMEISIRFYDTGDSCGNCDVHTTIYFDNSSDYLQVGWYNNPSNFEYSYNIDGSWSGHNYEPYGLRGIGWHTFTWRVKQSGGIDVLIDGNLIIDDLTGVTTLSKFVVAIGSDPSTYSCSVDDFLVTSPG